MDILFRIWNNWACEGSRLMDLDDVRLFTKVVQAGSNGTLRADLNALLDEFLATYPSSEFAPRIVLKRSIIQEEVSDEAIRALLDVPSNSEVYETARARAGR